MLGPVISNILGDCSLSPLSDPITTSFGMNFLGAEYDKRLLLTICYCTQGCLTCLNSMYGKPSLSVIIIGRVMGPCSVLQLISAKAHKQSSSAVHYTAFVRMSL